MKKLYFLLSIITMFSFNIFSMEISPKRKRSSGQTDNNKRIKLVEVDSILTSEESSQFAAELEEYQNFLVSQYKEWERQGLLAEGGRTAEEREKITGAIDVLTLFGLYYNGKLVEKPLESQVEIKHKEDKVSLVLYEINF